MFAFLLAPLIGVLTGILMLLNLLVWMPVLLVVSSAKLLPFKAIQLAADTWLMCIAETWVATNNGWIRLTQKFDWQVSGVENISTQQWYLVLCNHQSWVDVFVLQYALNRRIAPLKFFLKRELIWVPVMGLAWWALGFAFVRRRSKAYLQQHPQEIGKDAATTRQACIKYALAPTSVMNFVEGTRYTPAKQHQQQSPYQHLLKPKAGGITLVLQTMGEKFSAVLDVTIVYPQGSPTLVQFLMGRVKQVVVQVRTLELPNAVAAPDAPRELALRRGVEHWLNQLWFEKDAQIEQILRRSTPN